MQTIKTYNLNKSYGTNETRVDALKDVNMSIEKGEFVAIVGQSGSGKSTLLHLLGGVDRPTAGKVFIEGDDIYNLKENKLAIYRRRKIGFIFQFYNLLPVLTAEENIRLPLLMDRKPVDETYFNELIELMGLSERRNHLPSQLSGGQQQRVAIGRALIYKPSIILADEPTGNLDSKNSREIMDLLKLSVKKYGQTLILITHDNELACEADRIITIEDGQIVKDEVTKG